MLTSKLKLIFASIGIALTWMLVVPLFEFPDEQAHFETVEFIQAYNRLPLGTELDMTQEMKETQTYLGIFRNPLGQNRYTYHPEYNVEHSNSVVGKYESEIKALNTPENRTVYVGAEAARYPTLYYRYLGIFTGLVEKSDIILRLFITRLGGLFLAAALAYVAWLLGQELFKDKRTALVLPIITLLQPMFSFVTAGINSDNLHNLLFTAVIYLTLRLVKRGLSFWPLLALAGLTVLDIYTKPQGFIALPLIGIAFILHAVKERRYKAIFSLIIVSLLILVLGKGEWGKYVGYLSLGNPHGASFIEYLRFSLNKLMAQNVVWYWGVFKWLGVVLPPIYWRVANRIVLLAGLGFVVYLFRLIKHIKTIVDPFLVIYLVFVSAVYALAIFWFDWQYVKSIGFSLGIQARYFFPTIASHFALLIIGVLSFGWTDKLRLWLRRGLVIVFAWLQLGGLWRILTIYYDTSSLSTLIIQLSQYKPVFAKGGWWYLWGAIYLISFSYLIWQGLKSKPAKQL